MTTTRSCKTSLLLQCCCCLAAAIPVANATAKPSSLRHRIVSAIAAVLPQPLPQIQICAAAVVETAITLLPCWRPAVSTNPYFLCCRHCFPDVSAASLPPLPPGSVIHVFAATVAAISPLPLLLLTLLPSQVFSAPCCHSHCCCLAAASVRNIYLRRCRRCHCCLAVALPPPCRHCQANFSPPLLLLS